MYSIVHNSVQYSIEYNIQYCTVPYRDSTVPFSTNLGRGQRDEGITMSTVFSADGTAIGFDAWGDGPPLIMIDGATAYRAMSPIAAQVGALLRDELFRHRPADDYSYTDWLYRGPPPRAL